jgi:hypothetical protein
MGDGKVEVDVAVDVDVVRETQKLGRREERLARWAGKLGSWEAGAGWQGATGFNWLALAVGFGWLEV